MPCMYRAMHQNKSNVISPYISNFKKKISISAPILFRAMFSAEIINIYLGSKTKN